MTNSRYHSWGRYPLWDQAAVRLNWRSEPLPLKTGQVVLPFGNGRSYGDSCLNRGGVLLDARGLDRMIAFDVKQGVLCCEAGVLLSEILALVVPKGWFLPVVPGTQGITVGGAIANDIHGKNQVHAGTFGCHVQGFELLRSDGGHFWCSPSENQAWFRATVGGLGLTGLILQARIQLKRISGPAMAVETVRYSGIDEFLDIAAASDTKFEYTAAWMDCTARGRLMDRGLFFRGRHTVEAPSDAFARSRRFNIPLELPVSLVNRLSIGAYNDLYYRRQPETHRPAIIHYQPFFFPLDGIGNWNRLYGPRGFFQHQSIIPHGAGKAALHEMIRATRRAGIDPLLAVLKVFGDRPSPGLMSFPQPGVTLALDFPNQGQKTLRLLDILDEIVMLANGRVNPYKDARMSANCFKHSFPEWETLASFRDPKFSSSFWRRVTWV